MAKKSTVTKIPMYPTREFHLNGGWVENGTLSHASYDGERRWGNERDEIGRANVIAPVMVENVPFEDEIRFTGTYRGRSAAGMTFTNAIGQQFTVFLTDFCDMVPIMEKGIVKGKFIYCKRGMNYGLKLYE